MGVFHDGKRHGSSGHTFVLLARFEQHRLPSTEFDDLIVIPTDP
jgi:hypothetical protein